ncbi:MAG: hypothetical protein MK324_16640 [Pirellulales bacterium]|nr:hypothetical protein [Pirellulales bacterium]
MPFNLKIIRYLNLIDIGCCVLLIFTTLILPAPTNAIGFFRSILAYGGTALVILGTQFLCVLSRLYFGYSLIDELATVKARARARASFLLFLCAFFALSFNGLLSSQGIVIVGIAFKISVVLLATASHIVLVTALLLDTKSDKDHGNSLSNIHYGASALLGLITTTYMLDAYPFSTATALGVISLLIIIWRLLFWRITTTLYS